MLLTNVKNYIKQHYLVSLFDLTKHFNLNPLIARQMLQLLIAKGLVRECKKTNKCGIKCVKCDPLMIELYQWVDALSSSLEKNSLQPH